MKIKLELREEKYQLVKEQLTEAGIEVDDSAEYILIENESYIDHLMVVEPQSREMVRLDINDIVSIESCGHNVEVYTNEDMYYTSNRLYQLMAILNPKKFLRISNSVIIATECVKRIKPTFSAKFILTMSNGKKVDVTRNYYGLFREYFNL